jgi:hypothetical protein
VAPQRKRSHIFTHNIAAKYFTLYYYPIVGDGLMAMRTQHFEMVLNRTPSDAELDALYEAGLDDCSFTVGANGRPSEVWVDRKAKSFDEALESVESQLAACGFTAVEVRGKAVQKAGRPSFSAAGKRSPQITFVLPEQRLQQLVRLSAARGMNKSDVAREALYELLDRVPA